MANYGNLHTDEIRADQKHGAGPLVQTANAAYTTGNLAGFGTDGRIVDSGIAASGIGGSPTSPIIDSDGNPIFDANGNWIYPG
jgi:hypothetical protein